MNVTDEDLHKTLVCVQLKDLCAQYGIAKTGNKDEIVAR
jgi:hypothetical protein